MSMGKWQEYKLGEVAEVKGGKRLPKGEMLVSYETQHPYIRVTDMTQKWIHKKGLLFVTEQVQKSICRYTVNSGNVILSIVGSIGLVSRIGDDIDRANLTENCVKIIPNKNVLDDDYLYYYLISSNGQYEINKRNVGAVQPKLPIYNINDIVISLPSLNEQKKIAIILSSLDDKVDLLRRENATLEAMAETLFRQWFVVEAKEEWNEGNLGDLIEVKYGKDHKKLMDGNIPVFGSGGVMRYADTALYSKESVLIPRKGSLNNVMYINEPFWTVDTMFYTEMRRPNVAKYVYHLVKELDLANMNVGSAVPSMTTEVLNNIPIDIPPQTVFDKFEDAVSPAYSKIQANNKQIQTLIQTRDGLLPRLMSNEIKI